MDLTKFNPQNHLYKITEDTSKELYRIFTILEDEKIPFLIDDSESDSIILECKDYFSIFYRIRKYLDNYGKIVHIFRNRDYQEIENLPILENDSLRFENSLKINLFNGNWEYQDESGDIKEGILKYLDIKRKIYTDLSLGLKTIFDLGTLRSGILQDLLNNHNNKLRKGFTEIYFSRLKINFTDNNSKEVFNKFLESDNFPRCIPFKNEESNEYGYWIWPKKYVLNLGRDMFPKGELILKDLSTWNIQLEDYRSSIGNDTIIMFSEINRIFVKYISSKFLQLCYCDNVEYVRKTNFFFHKTPIIEPKKYKTYNDDLKKEIKLVFDLLKDRGYILGTSLEDNLYNLKEWRNIGIV